jgi:hypothetical protein
VEIHVPLIPALFLQVFGDDVGTGVEVALFGAQHWMSAAPGQCPASDVPPCPAHAEVEMQVPGVPEL